MKLNAKDIKPNPANPRQIKDDKFKKLVQSLKDFPEMAEVREVVVNKDHMILGGNMRYKAMIEAGWPEIPVKVVDWPEDKQREFIIKDNVAGGEWDWDILANEWDAELLDEWGLDLPTQFGEEEVEEDEAPEVSSEPPVSKLGEIYQLGRHRVMCGDSTVKENVDLLMGAAKADMVFTDPPYGIGVGGTMRKKLAVAGDDKNPKKFYKAIPTDIQEVYVWGAFHNIKDLNFTPDDCIVWVKENFGMGRGYRQQYEVCFYKGEFNGSDSDVWNYNRDRDIDHQTPKPVALCARAIKNSNPSNVLDLFLGSGSTLIACEQTDRTCYGMEIDPRYVDVIRKRYAKFIDPENWEASWETMTPKI